MKAKRTTRKTLAERAAPIIVNAGDYDLAELLSAVLNHPDTPVEIHNDLSDAIGGLSGYGRAHKSPEMIRAVLDATKIVESE